VYLLNDFLFFFFIFSISIFQNHLKDVTLYCKKKLSKFSSQNMIVHIIKFLSFCTSIFFFYLRINESFVFRIHVMCHLFIKQSKISFIQQKDTRMCQQL